MDQHPTHSNQHRNKIKFLHPISFPFQLAQGFILAEVCKTFVGLDSPTNIGHDFIRLVQL